MARKSTTAVTDISKIFSGDSQAALVVIFGDDLGRKFDLVTEATVIGRSPKNDIRLDQESVSRFHAKLMADGQKMTVEDLGSTNGTIVNSRVVKGRVRLRNGDLIKVGRTIFKFIASNNIEAAYHDAIYRMTTMDGLTEVFNRRYFEDALERELARARRYERPLSLVLVDLDHFKTINDEFGHLAGDAVLKEVALTMRSRTRREDVLARYGGEEFALLLPEVDHHGAAQLAEKARKLVERLCVAYQDKELRVTLSAGVATASKKKEEGVDLIRRADEKLYQAKIAGRNRVML